MSTIVPCERAARLAIVLAVGALVALVAVPAVGAASPAPTGSAAGAAAASGPGNAADGGLERILARHPLLAETVRADLTVVNRDGTTLLVHYEAGRISAVSGTSISVTGRDGKGATFVVTDATRVRRDGHPISIAALSVGDRAFVLGSNVGGTYTAFVIRSPKAPGA